MNRLPTKDECAAAYERGDATALEIFILENEPEGSLDADAWREGLLDSICEGLVPESDKSALSRALEECKLNFFERDDTVHVILNGDCELQLKFTPRGGAEDFYVV